MIYLKSSVIFITALLLFQCGTDPSEEAKKAYEAKDYSLAINLFKEAQVKHQNDTLHQDLLSFAYMYRGIDLYNKTKNIKALIGNFEQAEKYLPEDQSPEFSSEHSQLLTFLAKAYMEAKPETEIEKEEYFEKSVSIVKSAIRKDSTNQAALDLLEEIKQDQFQGLIDKAKELYHKAGKTRQVDFYFVSEYVFNQAAEFDAEHEEIKSYLGKIKKKTLGVLNYRDGVALAIIGYSHRKDRFSMDVAVANYLNKSLKLKLSRFDLIDERGNSYPLDPKSMKQNELLGKKVLADTLLNEENPSTAGNLVFTVPDTAKISHLAYKVDLKNISKKFFQ